TLALKCGSTSFRSSNNLLIVFILLIKRNKTILMVALTELRSSCQNKYGEPQADPKSDENPAKIHIDLLYFNELNI
ncbi:hypothetical protein, partial [Acinetobacter bereziniae]|uniref:hypothetical protein n=1 Tax=Acinetobacter bereziniae TaxID=106648 RepID=UPI001BB1D067